MTNLTLDKPMFRMVISRIFWFGIWKYRSWEFRADALGATCYKKTWLLKMHLLNFEYVSKHQNVSKSLNLTYLIINNNFFQGICRHWRLKRDERNTLAEGTSFRSKILRLGKTIFARTRKLSQKKVFLVILGNKIKKILNLN